jgi:Flp pilus assembly protein TadD
VLRAALAQEEGEALAARRAARAAERERLRVDQPAGWEEAEQRTAAEVQALDGEVRVHEERARVLGGAAFDALRALQRAGGDQPEIARGLGLHHALGGERDRAQAAIRAARAETPADPWLDLAAGWVEARQGDRTAHERAVVALGSLSVAHPDLLRARYLLARVQAALGRRTEALASVEGVLATNGRHEGAQRMLAELYAPAAPPPTTSAQSPSGSAPGNAPAQPRKLVAQPPEGTPPRAAGPTLAPIPRAARPTLAPVPGAVVPAPPPAAGGTPVEETGAAPSAAPSSPAGAGAAEPTTESAPRVRRPRTEQRDLSVNGG